MKINRECFLYIVLCFFITQVEATETVSLNLKCAVDSVLHIERIGDDSDIDIFANNPANLAITYNGANNIDVKFESEHDWNLVKSDDDNEKISYCCKFNEEKVTENKIVQNAEFSDGKYNFQLTFEAEKPIESYKPGEYADNVTATVSETAF